MSETITIPKFPHHDGDVSTDVLKKHVDENPHLYTGTLGEAVSKLITIDEPGTVDTDKTEDKKSIEVVDSDGWSRLIIDTPAEGVRVMFKGRYDLPKVEMIGDEAVGVSIRPLYHDEPTGLLGGVRSEQQTAYSGSHGADPRVIMQPGGVMKVVDLALIESAGRDLVLICDETPQGFRALFQAVSGLAGEGELSEQARRISLVEYSGLGEPSEEANGLLSELSVELTAALTSEDLTPHEALELVFLAHVGPEESRKAHSTRLADMIKERLKVDHFGGDEPEVYQERKSKLVDELKDPERNDYWVHRDKGLLRPADRILTGGSYIDYPRHTTHGCLNVAIDVERNIYGSGGHGVAGEAGSTTVASPMASFVEVNGMPVNLEAADTYFVNNQGLVIPEGSLLVTVSPDEPPEDKTGSEIWLPLTITDEDIENGALQKIADSIKTSIYMSVLSDEEKDSLLYQLERVIRGVDHSWEVQSLASSAIMQSEIERIARTNGLTEEQAREEYYRRVRERPGLDFEKLVIVDGRELNDFPYDDRAKQEAIKLALDRFISEFRVSMSGEGFSVDNNGGLIIPAVFGAEKIGHDGYEEMLAQVRNCYAFKKLSLEKQEHFLEALKAYFTTLPSDEALAEQHQSGYGYNHEWGYGVKRKAHDVLVLEFNKLGDDKELRELYKQAEDSNLAKSMGQSEQLNVYAAALAIKDGGSDDEIKARYYELINRSKVQASGLVRSERLKDWVTYNIIDQDEFKSTYTEILETNLSKARAQRRTDYLQVWLVNTYVSKTRGKPTPKLESFGRGLDWDVPGATEQIRQDYALAESVGLETARHADSMMSSYESETYSELKRIKRGIAEKPEDVSYERLISYLKKLPLGLAARYVRAGMVSFDQDELKNNGEHSRIV